MTKEQYWAAHQWIKDLKGPADRCDFCDNHNAFRYEWSNISGYYRYDIDDWQMLCKKCHFRFDSHRSYLKQGRKLQAIYGTTDFYEVMKMPKAVREAMKQEWLENQANSITHPLLWTERELQYLAERGLDMRSLYLAMDNTLGQDEVVPRDFIEWVEELRSDNYKERREIMLNQESKV